jgi:hypothetical protein
MDPYARSREAHRLAELGELVQPCYFGQSGEQLGATAYVQHSMQFGVIAQTHGQHMMKAPRQTHDYGLSLRELASDLGDAIRSSPGESIREFSYRHVRLLIVDLRVCFAAFRRTSLSPRSLLRSRYV